MCLSLVTVSSGYNLVTIYLAISFLMITLSLIFFFKGTQFMLDHRPGSPNQFYFSTLPRYEIKPTITWPPGVRATVLVMLIYIRPFSMVANEKLNFTIVGNRRTSEKL